MSTQTTPPTRYAVIGNPIAHSRSPTIHTQFALQTGQHLSYVALLAAPNQFASGVDQVRGDGGAGMNVTMPFKLDAFAYANDCSERARAAGAVNTLLFDGNRCYGENTDGAGLINDLQGRLALPLAGSAILVLGAGGATRGIVPPLLGAGVRKVHIVNRSADKANALVAALANPRVTASGWDKLAARTHGFDIVINATSAALSRTTLPIPAAYLRHASVSYEMFYGSAPTPFMVQARQAGCARVSDGLGMLVEQAAESFFLWRGVRPQTAPVYVALRAELDAALA